MKSFFVITLTLTVAVVAFVSAQPIYPESVRGIHDVHPPFTTVVGLGNHGSNSIPILADNNWDPDFSDLFDVYTDADQSEDSEWILH